MAEEADDERFYPKKPGVKDVEDERFYPKKPGAKDVEDERFYPKKPGAKDVDDERFYPKKPGVRDTKSDEAATPPIPRALSPEVTAGKASGSDAPAKKQPQGTPPVPPKAKSGSEKKLTSYRDGSIDDERGGYDADDFLEPVSEDLKCLTCLNVLRDPVLTGCCGTRMCQSCVDALMKSRFSHGCPQCREPKESMVTMLDRKLQREMGQMRIRCAHHSLGCAWVGTLRERMEHLKGECELELLECPNACGRKMPRFRLSDHLEMACPKRKYWCPHCSEEGVFDEIMEKHYPVCEKFPVLCSNRCEFGTIERSRLEHHLKEECPLQPVKCDFFEVGPGCRVEVLREDLPKHLEDFQIAHLGMMASEVRMLTKENGELLKDVQEHSKSLQDLQRETHTLMKTVPLVPTQLTLNEYRKKRDQKLAWYSPPFYTHVEGYKMGIKAYPTGEPKSQYFAVYPIMHRGEYDDQLDFPVDIEFRVQLVQKENPAGERYERVQTFRFKRCIMGSVGDDEGFTLGWPDFIRRDFLENPKHGPKYQTGNTVMFWINATPLLHKPDNKT